MLRNPWILIPITPQNVAITQTMIGNLHNAYGPSLKNMTPKDKQSCLKVGNPQLAMIDQVKEVCDAHPNVMPAWHSVQDFEMRIDTMKNLSSMRKVVSSLLEAIDGTLTGAKSDCMQITLAYYRALKHAATSSLPGLRVHAMEIRENFIHQTGKSPEDEYPENEGKGLDDNPVPAN